MARIRMLAIFFCAFVPAWSPAAELQIYAEAVPANSETSHGLLQGAAIAVVREIQRRVGDSSPIQAVPWGRAYHQVEHEPNVAVLQVVRTSSRDPLFQWVGPFDQFSSELFAGPDSDLHLTALEDAKAIPHIGVMRGSYLDEELTSLGFTNLDRQPTLALALLKIRSNRIAVIASDTDTIDDLIVSGVIKKEELKPIFQLMTASNYIMFSKSTATALVDSWQAALDAMKSDGTFSRLYAQRPVLK